MSLSYSVSASLSSLSGSGSRDSVAAVVEQATSSVFGFFQTLVNVVTSTSGIDCCQTGFKNFQISMTPQSKNKKIYIEFTLKNESFSCADKKL